MSLDTPLAIEGKSPGQLAWIRFKKDKVAVIALAFSTIIVTLALFAPWVCALLNIDPYSLDKTTLDKFGLPNSPFGGISRNHPLGVEPGTGRDILARLIYGTRVSLVVALIATFITTLFGVVLGIWAGYKRGIVDGIIGRIIDLLLAFPSLLLIISLAPVLQPRLVAMGFPEGNPARMTYIILILSLFGWTYIARIMRGQALSLREREFVAAAQACGAKTSYMIFKEILPNLWAPIIVYASLTVPGYIAIEATFSFLGLGVVAPTASWGGMLADSVRYFRSDPAYLFIPGTALFLLVLAFNLVGDGLRDALDPKGERAQKV
ncbi:MAG: ABC transporter permease [Candidatus Nanopelagicales bacterium]|jgi:ABC-type dipeptide/oligopeptide/nickel transport system permease subunit|nr:ABC transporter permease [Candidatus Nanopelagicales bacterium]MBJ7394253.1 ABC transporter permease [Candidatus Nanopelagicales bacterium]